MNAFSKYCVAHLGEGKEKTQPAFEPNAGTHDEKQQLKKTHQVESRPRLRDLVQALGLLQRSQRENVNYITFDSVRIQTVTQVCPRDPERNYYFILFFSPCVYNCAAC